MFLILIATLTAATVQGFPQLTLYQPQYQVQLLPIVKVPERSLRDFDQKLRLQNVVVYEISGGVQSDLLNAEVLPFYRNTGVNQQLKVEPYRDVNSAYGNSEFVNKQNVGLTASTIRDSHILQWTSVLPRNGFESKGLPSNNDQAIEINSKIYDVPKNSRLTQDANLKTELTSRKPVIVSERSYSQIDNHSKLEITPNFPQNTNPNSQNPEPNSTNIENHQKTIEQNDDVPQKTNEDTTNLDDKGRNSQTKDTNITLKTGKVNAKPVPTLNGTDDVENAMQSPRPPVHFTPGSRSSIDSVSNKDDEHFKPGSRSGIDSSGNIDEEDRWIWNVTEKVETTTPDIENRVSFDGSNCPTGQVRVAGMCVQKDDK